MGSIPATLDITAVRQKKIKIRKHANKIKLPIKSPLSPRLYSSRLRTSSFTPHTFSHTSAPHPHRPKRPPVHERKLSYERKQSISLTRSRWSTSLHPPTYFSVRPTLRGTFFSFEVRKSVGGGDSKDNRYLRRIVANAYLITPGKVSQFSPYHTRPLTPTLRISRNLLRSRGKAIYSSTISNSFGNFLPKSNVTPSKLAPSFNLSTSRVGTWASFRVTNVLFTQTFTNRFNSLQKLFFSHLTNYHDLRNHVTSYRIWIKRLTRSLPLYLLHKLAPSFVLNKTHLARLPYYADVPKVRAVGLSTLRQSFSLTTFVSTTGHKSLDRTYAHLPPYSQLRQMSRLKAKTLAPDSNQFAPKIDTTKLTTFALRKFMHKRLFRLKPLRTNLRRTRRRRRLSSKFNSTSLVKDLIKHREEVNARYYERDLFAEMLEDRNSPMLEQFLYTGFERMPLMDQEDGNNLFLKARKVRPSLFLLKSPKLGQRRYVVRNYLLLEKHWAKESAYMRTVFKDCRNIRRNENLSNRATRRILRRRSLARRRWGRRVRYFARHSSTYNSIRRYAARQQNSRTWFLKTTPQSRNANVQDLIDSLSPNLNRQNRKRAHRPTFRTPPKPRTLKTVRNPLRIITDFRSNATPFHKTISNAKFKQPNRKLEKVTSWRRNKTLAKVLAKRWYRQIKSKVATKRTRILHSRRQKSFKRSQTLFNRMSSPHYFAQVNPHTSYNDCSQPPLVSSENAKRTTLAHLSTPLSLLSKFWSHPTFIKYLLTKPLFNPSLIAKPWTDFQYSNLSINFTSSLQTQLNSYCFNSQLSSLHKSNLWSVASTQHVLRKKILRSVTRKTFRENIIPWAHKCLIRFAENLSGRRTAVNVGPFVEQSLTVEDHARFALWTSRADGFRKYLGHRIFTSEGVMLIAAAFRLKDPTILANWIRAMLGRMSFWKYRVLFRYIKFLVQHLFRFSFKDFQFKGFKLRLKGKISVGGNSRARSLSHRIGETSNSKMIHKVAYDLSYVNTFTGVLGFKLRFFY